jgi:hypothetical protein
MLVKILNWHIDIWWFLLFVTYEYDGNICVFVCVCVCVCVHCMQLCWGRNGVEILGGPCLGL